MSMSRTSDRLSLKGRFMESGVTRYRAGFGSILSGIQFDLPPYPPTPFCQATSMRVVNLPWLHSTRIPACHVSESRKDSSRCTAYRCAQQLMTVACALAYSAGSSSNCRTIASPKRSRGDPSCALNHQANPGDSGDQPMLVHIGAMNIARVPFLNSEAFGRAAPDSAVQTTVSSLPTPRGPNLERRTMLFNTNLLKAGQPLMGSANSQRPWRFCFKPLSSSEAFKCGRGRMGFSCPDSRQCLLSLKSSVQIFTSCSTAGSNTGCNMDVCLRNFLTFSTNIALNFMRKERKDSFLEIPS
mmetsp:Transcript_26783/g.77371  ORF Transcript_26783/g.77371 Transcript_26783/m.77371 type:complete len:298 (+) Transcript_26783:459-1352(+)